ncbi:hypothetical protein [Methanoregula sp.]|uniref:hypothetical protein n=1 Tax=Methanoregula sp. TaxID=2052170 RepID=UPI003BAF6612
MKYYPAGRNVYRGICLLLLAVALGIPCATAVTLTPGSTAITTIAQGDPVYIQGIATGHPQVGLQIWFIGYNFVKVSTVQVNDDNTYEYELQQSDTAKLAAGEYVVLIQHPMENGVFDVVYDPSSGTVTNVQTGKQIFQLTGSGSLQSTGAVTALMNAIGSQNIDDTFAVVTFYVSQPATSINPIGDLQQGEKFTINGTTNLAAGDNLMVDITSSSFNPTSKTAPSGFSGAGGMIQVVPGNGRLNTWSFVVDTSTFVPDEYLVKVSGVEQAVTASARFDVVCNGSGDTCSIPVTSTTATIAPAATLPANVTTALPATPALVLTSVPATTQVSPVPAALCLGSIMVVVLLARRLI